MRVASKAASSAGSYDSMVKVRNLVSSATHAEQIFTNRDPLVIVRYASTDATCLSTFRALFLGLR